MVTSVLVKDNRPEAVSSAHWGDVSITSSEGVFLEAALKLLTIKIPVRAIQEFPLNSITLTKVDAERTTSQWNESPREKTGI